MARKSKYLNCIINDLKIIDNYGIKNKKYYTSMFIVVCVHCNKTFNVRSSNILMNKCRCECQKKYINHNTNGDSQTRLYEVYKKMIERTTNCNNKKYKYYGDRGIKVCNEWLNNYQAFKKWAYENGYNENAPKGQYTLDRIDVDGNYEPSNCRFISIKEQQYNKRNNHFLELKGERMTLTEWALKLNINVKTLEKRTRMGWDDERVLTTPVNSNYRKKGKYNNGNTKVF